MNTLNKIGGLASLLLILLLSTLSYADIREDAVLDYKSVINSIIETTIIPRYEDLQATAETQISTINQLCQSADTGTLQDAQDQFEKLVISWSGAEIFRFGPAREDNRFERLFFWPDRRSRGIKQVREILASENAAALDVTTLKRKSVAVQGILSLEYLLFGQGFESLANGTKDTFRCRYALAVSTAIHETARAILKDWKSENGFSRAMQNAGPDNPVFKTDQEVIRDILQHSVELLQSMIALKLAPSLQDDHSSAKPKRIPFWRSNLFLSMMDANLGSLHKLQQQGQLYRLLPLEDRGTAAGLLFEISQIRSVVTHYRTGGMLWKDILQTKDGYAKFKYLLNPIKGAQGILAELYPQALGITMGFNSLDGD